MLTGAQLRTVAYQVEDGIICPDCLNPAEANAAERGDEYLAEGGVQEICAYSADEFAGDDGLYCGRCGGTIVDPPELDYVVTIKLTAVSGIDRDALETAIDTALDKLDEVSRVYSLAVDRD